MFENRAAGEV